MSVQVPVITSFSPDTGLLTGNPNMTDANVLTLTGTAAPNTAVEVFNGTTLLGTGAVNASGVWTFTTPVLGTGFFGVSLTAVDVAAGASSAASAALNLTINTTVPTSPVITSYSPVTGTPGSTTTTAQVLTLSGTSDPSQQGFIDVYDGTTLLGQATINPSNGTWTFQTGTLAVGNVHQFTATFTDWEGATSPASAAFDVQVVTPPTAPAITSIGPDTGVAGDGITSATVLTLNGTAAANITVDIYDGSALLGQTTANINGIWAFTTSQLTAGTHNFSAIAVDGSGNPSAASSTASMTIDDHTPAAPVFLTESVGADNVLTVTGSAEANDTINVYDGTTLLGTTVANGAGAWSFVTGTMSAGTHNLVATATDLAGTTGPSSGDPTVTISGSAGAPPPTPVILSASPDSGPANNLVTPSNELRLVGTAAAGTTITVFDGTTELGTTTANLSGVWTFTTSSPLSDGSHMLSVTSTNASGAVSAQSASLNITVQPDIGSFSPLTDQWSNPISIDGSPFYVENADVNGNAPWAITETDPQTLRFTLKQGDTWADNGSHRTEVASGTIFAPADTINVGYQFQVEPGATNQFWTVIGQFHSDDNSSITQAMNPDYPPFSIHLTGPGGVGQGDYLAVDAYYALPGATAPTEVGGGFLYIAPTPIVRGQYYDVQISANFQNNSNGFLEMWVNGTQIINYHGPLGYGAGNYWKEGIYQDPSSTGETITADYKNLVISGTPTAPLVIGDTVNGNRAMLSGTAEANSTLTVYDGTTKLGTTKVNSDGSWAYETGALSIGTHALTATATDPAGKVSGASQASDATITSSTTPVVTKVTPSPATGEKTVGTAITFALATSTAVTVAGTPTLSLNNGGIATYVSGSGTSALTFSYTVGANDGTVAALAVTGINFPNGAAITDTSGNALSPAGVISTFLGLEVDITPVRAPVFTTSTTNSNGTFTLNGTAGANTTVTISDDGNILGTAAVNGSGSWTFTTPTMVNGTWNEFSAVDTNSLGDTTASVAGPQYGESTKLPSSPVVTGNALTGNVVTLYGTVGANTTVKVFDGATLLGTTTGNASGIWSFATAALSNGVHTFTTEATNASGTSGASEPVSLTVGTAAPPVTPKISSITESPSSGDLNAGHSVTLTVNFNEAVTVVGGTPSLTLNDGGTATYAGGSGSSALTFSYTVGTGQNIGSLAATAVNLNGATITDGGGNAASLSLTNLTQVGPQVDTTPPNVSSVVASGAGIAAGSGDLKAGSVVTLTVNLSEAVSVANGVPTLTLNDGGTATYAGGSSPTSALTFTYTVGAGDNTPDLTVKAVNLNSATVTDGAGNAADLSGAVTNPAGTLQIDTTPPTVSSVVASGAGISAQTGNLSAGDVVTLTVNLSEVVTVANGTPTLVLNDGGTATYSSGSGTNALTFTYTVGSTDSTVSALAITQVNLPGGTTITDAAGNAANLAGALTTFSGLAIDPPPALKSITETPSSGDLNAGKTVTLTLNLNDAVTVTGGPLTLSLNDGGVATYQTGSGTNTLTFTYTVGAGQNIGSLAVTGVNLNGATVLDGGGNPASFALTGLAQNGPQIDTTTPTVASVVTSGAGITAGSGEVGIGSVVTFTVNLNEAVTVANGVPTLTLNDGGTAYYTGGSSPTNTLTFSYTVGAGQSTSDLAVKAVNLNSATVTDGAGNAADLSGAVTNPAGILQISTSGPTVKSVTDAPANSDLDAGNSVTITVNMTAPVIVSGTPSLALNDGGTATYTGGTGLTSALTFTYVVAAGQNTSDLTITGVNLGSATIKDQSGNLANLNGAVTNPTGTVKIDTTAPTVTSVTEHASSNDVNAGKVATFYVMLSEGVTIAGGVPTLTLNDGGTAYCATSSYSNELYFNYTVAAGQNTSALTVKSVNLNSATVTDRAGNAADLSGLMVAPTTTLQIDTTSPTITQVVASPGTGSEGPGSVIVFTLQMSEAVRVAGTPTLTLNDGGTATFTGGSGTNALTFSYRVGANDGLVSALGIKGVNLPNGATITDLAGNAANLAGAVTTLAGLHIVNTNQTIATGGTLELTSPYAGTVTFAGSTGKLKIDNSASFTGRIGGQLAVGDVIDLADITAGAKATVHYTGHNSPGTLTVSDGVHTATLPLLGNYSLANFTVSSDGHGGTDIVDPPLQQGTATGSASAIDRGAMLWSQYMASAFPEVGYGTGGNPTNGSSGLNHDRTTQLAGPGINQHHV